MVLVALRVQDNLTPLHVAGHCGNVRMAKLLLERSADINAKATVCGFERRGEERALLMIDS